MNLLGGLHERAVNQREVKEMVGVDKAFYEITLRGVLDPFWTTLFEGMTIETKENVTRISGFVADQAALHGMLAKVRDFGLVLVSISSEE
jgi:hypothetical protein